VDEYIARFFVDRKVPPDNAFWKHRLLYIGRGNGFVNIPVYYHILFKLGIPLEELLKESQLELMERIMHFAILTEKGEINMAAQLEGIEALLEGRIRNPAFDEELRFYLRQNVLRPLGRLGLKVPALNRADAYLYILCDLELSAEQTNLALKYWYALHPSYLLMDDIYDYKKDKHNGEENAIVELGDGKEGFAAAFEMLEENCKTLATINPVLSHTMEELMEGLHDLIV
jgi:hypothetical protein